jgi:hypothetical protein
MNIQHRILFTAALIPTALACLAYPVQSRAAAWNAVSLAWTAPGDDGNVGRASNYDVRYSTSTISGTDTTAWWNQATQCSGEPVPQQAGATETFTVGGLQPSTTYYFILKTADEVPNWSRFSNVAVKATTALPDSIAPAAVRNLAECENPDFLLVLDGSSVIVSELLRGRGCPVSGASIPEVGWPIFVRKIRWGLPSDGGFFS